MFHYLFFWQSNDKKSTCASGSKAGAAHLLVTETAPELHGVKRHIFLILANGAQSQLKQGLHVLLQSVVVQGGDCPDSLIRRLPHTRVGTLSRLAHNLRGTG